MFPTRRAIVRAATAAVVPSQAQVSTCRAARIFAAAIAQQPSGSFPQQRRAFTQSPAARSDAFDNMAAEVQAPPAARDESRSYRAGDRKRSLFVGNIASDLTADDVRDIFAEHAPVEDVVKGVGGTHWFVYFKDEETALRVQETTHGVFVRGRQLRVQPRLGTSVSGGSDGGMRQRQPRREAQTLNDPSPTLFIGNMPYNMTDQDLNELSKKLEYCFDIRVAIDRHTGWPRGYAHADFYTVGLAQRALKKLMESRATMGPNVLRIDFAQGVRGGTQSWTLSRLRALKTAGKNIEDYDKLTEELKVKEGGWEIAQQQ